jgi:hypothetical protein
MNQPKHPRVDEAEMRVFAVLLSGALSLTGPALAEEKSAPQGPAAAEDGADRAPFNDGAKRAFVEEGAKRARAIADALAAWRTAEAEFGDHETTALRAYEYGRIVVRHDRQSALAPFRRALEITRKGIGALDPWLLEINVAATAVETDARDRAAAEMLFSALSRSGDEPNRVDDRETTARGWIALSRFHLQARAYEKARLFSGRGVKVAETVSPPNPLLTARGLVYGGIARIADSARLEGGLDDGRKMLDRAFALFPPQENIDTFDRLLALAMAWEKASDHVQGEGESRREEFGEEAQIRHRWRNPKSPACNAEWSKRQPPRLAAATGRKPVAGAVVIGFDLDDQGVARSVVLASLHGPALGEAAQKAMKSWRLKSPPAPECRTNYITTISYDFR